MLEFCKNCGRFHASAVSSCQRNCAEWTFIVASVLHFKKRSGSSVGLRGRRGMESIEFFGRRYKNDRRFFFFKIIEIGKEAEFFFTSEYGINSIDLSDFIRPQLCIASRHNYKPRGIIAPGPPDYLAAFPVGVIGNGTGIYDINIGTFTIVGNFISPFKKLLSYSRCFGIV